MTVAQGVRAKIVKITDGVNEAEVAIRDAGGVCFCEQGRKDAWGFSDGSVLVYGRRGTIQDPRKAWQRAWRAYSCD